MCQFKSAIVVREPRDKCGFRLIMSPATNSHSSLIAAHNLKDDRRLKFARVEFVPRDISTLADVSSYKLKIDEERTPSWFNADMKRAATEKMARYISSIIAKDGQSLLGGEWIVPKGATVAVLENTVVTDNNGTVTENSGTVTDNSGTVTDNYGTVTDNYGTVTDNYGTVTDNYGTVTDNYGTGKIITDHTK